MKIYSEKSLRNFEFWSGAVETALQRATVAGSSSAVRVCISSSIKGGNEDEK